MKYILVILFLALSSFTQKDKNCLEIDIMLVGDYSSSVQGDEQFVVEAFRSFSNQFELSESTIKIGIITFNYDASLIAQLTDNKQYLNQQLDSLSKVQGQFNTSMDKALYLAANELMGRGRPGYKKIIILVSDGDVNGSSTPSGIISISNQLKSIGISICSVLIKNESSSPELMREVAGNCYVESDYKNLIDELKKLDLCL
jgi:Mg-chelatase subunit ChlD